MRKTLSFVDIPLLFLITFPLVLSGCTFEFRILERGPEENSPLPPPQP